MKEERPKNQLEEPIGEYVPYSYAVYTGNIKL
jgi:hypothetical protein